jgi:hypothetical protein
MSRTKWQTVLNRTKNDNLNLKPLCFKLKYYGTISDVVYEYRPRASRTKNHVLGLEGPDLNYVHVNWFNCQMVWNGRIAQLLNGVEQSNGRMAG